MGFAALVEEKGFPLEEGWEEVEKGLALLEACIAGVDLKIESPRLVAGCDGLEASVCGEG